MTDLPPADVVQYAQSKLLQLQNRYHDTDLEFWALAVAWEAARFAWYVVTGDRDSACAKLHSLKDAIGDFEQLDNRHPSHMQ